LFTHLLSNVDAETVRKWVTKLLDPTINKKVRNSYVAFLAFQMQNMKISEPFIELPPKVLEEPTKMMNVRMNAIDFTPVKK